MSALHFDKGIPQNILSTRYNKKNCARVKQMIQFLLVTSYIFEHDSSFNNQKNKNKNTHCKGAK